MLKPEVELRHLHNGPGPEELPSGVGLVRFVAQCRGDAGAVLNRSREVLDVVLRQAATTWPPPHAWASLLPRWFVTQCAPEMSPEEASADRERWRRLTWEEQAREQETERWSLGGWIYWFERRNRSWFWWDATVENPDTLYVSVEVEGAPFASGALEWLLRASGAVTVREWEEP